MKKQNGKKPQFESLVVSDQKGSVFNLEWDAKGKWYVVTSILDPELATQGRTVDEAIANAYDAQRELAAYRADAARPYAAEDAAPARRRRKVTGTAPSKKTRRKAPAGVRS